MTAAPMTSLTARSPEDLLAVIPVVLGFTPDESVVMLTFGARSTFHARVDLPRTAEEVAEVVDSLLEPARRHRVRRVVFVLYTDDAVPARTASRALRRAFTRAGIDVVDVLRADGHRWYSLAGARGVPAHGVPYDVSAHPFLAQSVLDGQVTHGSRAELARSLAGDPVAAGEVAEAARSWSAAVDAPGGWLEEAFFARELVERCLEDRSRPEPGEVARLLVALRHRAVRDLTLASLERDNARQHAELWSALVRQAPVELLAAPAGVLALAAWLAGHGALAWCAVERCTEADPEHPLAVLVAALLENAVPPEAWDEAAPRRLRAVHTDLLEDEPW